MEKGSTQVREDRLKDMELGAMQERVRPSPVGFTAPLFQSIANGDGIRDALGDAARGALRRDGGD